MIIIGTSHFVSFPSALSYYREQEVNLTHSQIWETVKAKIREGEILIGKPPLKPGQRLITIDNGCRYGIEESN